RVLIRSNIETAASPENSFTLTAFAVADGNVTVIVLPDTSAVVMREEKTTVRTPAVPVPFAMSASREYVFPAVSDTVTVPVAGSIAMVTITVLLRATPAAGTVTEIVVPAVVFPAVPTFFTNAICAAARDAGSASRSSSESAERRPIRDDPGL